MTAKKQSSALIGVACFCGVVWFGIIFWAWGGFA